MANFFKYILLNETEWTSLTISLRVVPKVQINNIPSLVQMMAWLPPGYKPLSEQMVGRLLTRICLNQAKSVKCMFP